MRKEPSVDQECVEAYTFSTPPLRLLIFRRPPARRSRWVPVSGKVDPTDRSLREATRRELAEETGFVRPRRLFGLDWQFRFRGPDHRRWRLHAYAVEVPAKSEPRLSREHSAFAWVSPAEAIRRLHYADNREAVRRLVRAIRAESSIPPPRSRAVGSRTDR